MKTSLQGRARQSLNHGLSNAEGVPQKGRDEDENNNTGWNDDWRYEPLNHDQLLLKREAGG